MTSDKSTSPEGKIALVSRMKYYKMKNKYWTTINIFLTIIKLRSYKYEFENINFSVEFAISVQRSQKDLTKESCHRLLCILVNHMVGWNYSLKNEKLPYQTKKCQTKFSSLTNIFVTFFPTKSFALNLKLSCKIYTIKHFSK